MWCFFCSLTMHEHLVNVDVLCDHCAPPERVLMCYTVHKWNMLTYRAHSHALHPQLPLWWLTNATFDQQNSYTSNNKPLLHEIGTHWKKNQLRFKHGWTLFFHIKHCKDCFCCSCSWDGPYSFMWSSTIVNTYSGDGCVDLFTNRITIK